MAIQEEAQALLDREQTLTHGHLRIAADPAHHVVPTMAALKKRAGSLAFALSDNELVPGSITPEVLEQAMAAADIRPRSIVDVQTRGGCARGGGLDQAGRNGVVTKS